MTNLDLDPQSDLHLDNSSASSGISVQQSSNVSPRELSMDSVNSELVSKQPAVSLSGIAGISSVAETLKGNQPSAQQSNEIEVIEQHGEVLKDEVETEGSQTVLMVVLALFLVSLAAASYFLYKYFTA